jgi:hypothetical protein
VAAVAYSITDSWVVDRPDRPDRLDARVYRLDTRTYQPEARVYRRRRAVALMALVVVALVAVTGVRLALAGSGGGALTASGSSGAASSSSSGHVYVVQPGDSLWSIVEATGRGGDPRPEVDRLAAQLGGRPLVPGQRLRLPGQD